MSNVKINGNTYNGVDEVRLMKADESGYAIYKEGQEAAENILDIAVARGAVGSYRNEAGSVCLSVFCGLNLGDLEFPFATSATGGVTACKASRVLLPNVTTLNVDESFGATKYNLSAGFQQSDIGLLDLSGLTTSMNNACKFTGAKIGTLKLGGYFPAANLWNGTKITNAILSGFSTADATGIAYFSNATITNMYVPADKLAEAQQLKSEGKLSKVTNIYSIADWSDD